MADGTPKECWRSSIKEDVRPLRFAEGFFYGVDDKGVEEGGPTEGRVKKCPVDTFLARGRLHGWPTALQRSVGGHPSRKT